ncbi:MAG: hypothetical protein U9O20_00145 [Patescibacteria group bacterium]|nr:hypothetical protein [Patescibacteria group bacterium]
MTDVVVLDKKKSQVLSWKNEGARKSLVLDSCGIKSHTWRRERTQKSNIFFFGGVFVVYDEKEEYLVFVGTLLNYVGGLGECRFFVSIDTKATMSLIEIEEREK